MFESSLKKAIDQFGSISQFAKKLGVRRENVSAWLNRNVRISLEYALKIDQLTNGEVSWEELTPTHVVRLLKDCTLIEENNYSFESVYVSIDRIQHDCCYCELNTNDEIVSLSENIRKYGLRKSICMDSDNNLIFGEKRIHAYQILDRRTIPSWRLSLSDLLNGEYSREDLSKIFDVSERVAIGLALENFVGNRQAQSYDEGPVHNSAQSDLKKGKKTRSIIAKCLNFGSHFTYQQAKKVYLSRHKQLIKVVNQDEISVSSAALLTKLSFEEITEVLKKNNKEITILASQLRNNNKKTTQ